MVKAASKNTVSLSRGSLVLSLPEAVQPVVWRIDLKQAQAASFTVKDENGKSALVKKEQGGAEEIIALFEFKEEAMGILMDVSSALQGEKTTSVRITEDMTVKGELIKWGVALGGVLVVVILFFYLASISPQAADPFTSAGADIQRGTGSPDATGVPVSADAFLSGQ